MISFWTRFRELCRMMAPGIMTMLLVLLGAVNLQMAGIAYVMPVFTVMAVFYWAIYWPEVIPRWFVFLLGLFHDLIHALPPGISSLLLLMLWTGLTTQRRHLLNEPFLVIWPSFAVCALMYASLEWLAQMVYHTTFFWDDALWVRLLLSVLCYPLIHKLMTSLHKVILRP